MLYRERGSPFVKIPRLLSVKILYPGITVSREFRISLIPDEWKVLKVSYKIQGFFIDLVLGKSYPCNKENYKNANIQALKKLPKVLHWMNLKYL